MAITQVSPTMGLPMRVRTFSAKASILWEAVGGIFLFTTANWASTLWRLERMMKATTGTVQARLYNVTDSTAVAGSDISTVETSYTRVRSSSFSLTDGKEYQVQAGRAGSGAGFGFGGRVIDFP